MQSRVARLSSLNFLRRRFAVNAIASESELDTFINSSKVSIVDFGASWCGPCRALKPLFEELSEKHANLSFVYVDIDDHQELAADFEIQGVPTVMLYKDGQQLEKLVGFDPNKLTALVEKHGATEN